jgi:2-polyprenyl-3-methyl-5-hydroxy-6-metoxy-1,4-benzoquinol methylase
LFVKPSHIASQPSPEESFRSQVLDSYISRGSGAHERLTRDDLRKFDRVYRYYLRHWLPETQRGSWLDVACGQGAILRLALGLGFRRVEGVDVSEEMLASCRTDGLTVHNEDVRSFLMRADGGAWDVVSAFDILEHFTKADAHAILSDIRRILSPAGICIVKVPNAASPWGPGVQASDLTHETSFTPASLLNIARLAGFRACTFRETAPPPTSVIARARGLLWRGVRAGYALLNMIETGSSGSGVYTRVMFAKLEL